MAKAPYFLASERVVGSQHATLPDTINRALRWIMQQSGFNPDGDFPGFNARRNPIGDGADATGAVDSAASINLSITNATTAGLEFYPGTYLVSSNITISKASKFHDGAKLKPAAGVSITFSAPISAGDWAIFDFSASGTVSLPSKQIANPMWFGVKGDNSQSETPALTSMTASLADYSTVEFPGGIIMRLDTTWAVASRRGLVFRSRVSPFPDGGNAAQFRWNGGAGGTMMQVFSCDGVEVRNFFWNMGPSSSQYATVAIDLDQTGVAGVTGTHCTVEGNVFNALSSPATSYSAVRIGQTASGNQEYHLVVGNHFFGSGFPFTANNGISATIAGGALGVATINSLPNPLVIGTQYRVRIAGAGASLGVLDTTLTATSTSSGTLLVAASQAVTGAICIVGQSYGWAINIGGSFSGQAKGIYIHDNSIIGFAKGIYLQNGSFLSFKNNFNGNEVDIQCDNATETCEDHFSNTEQSRQHVILNNSYQMPFRFQACRWGNLCQGPSKGWMEFNSGSAIEVTDAEFDNVPATGTLSTAYDFTNMSGTFRAVANRYAGGWTSTQVGYTTTDAQGNIVYPKNLSNRIESIGETGITGWPGRWVSGERTESRGADIAGAGIFEVQTQGATIPKHIGLVGRALVTKNSNESDVLVGVQGTVIKNFGGGGLVRWTKKAHMVEAQLPVVNTESFVPVWLHGFHVTAPVMSGGGDTVPIAGLYIEDLRAGGGATTPTNTFGITQVGLTDPNTLNGITTFGSAVIEKATTYIDIAAAGNATPNAAGAMLYRYRIAGAATINAPTNPQKGMRLKVIIFNNTAGAITPTMNGVFLGTGFGAIGAGKSRSREYVYDDVRVAWEPVCSVSEDF